MEFKDKDVTGWLTRKEVLSITNISDRHFRRRIKYLKDNHLKVYTTHVAWWCNKYSPEIIKHIKPKLARKTGTRGRHWPE